MSTRKNIAENIKFPLLVVNFKAYKQATGKYAEKLAKAIETASKNFNITVAVAVQSADIYRVSRSTSLLVFAQHIDKNPYGPFTGSLLPEAARENNAAGTILNHSEKRLSFSELRECLKRAKEAGLLTIACARDKKEAVNIQNLKPDIISVEPPELISTGRAVSRVSPKTIIETVKNVRDIPVICGAGITTGKDAKEAIRLGSLGIMVSSAIVLSKTPEKKTKELCESLETFNRT